MQPISPTLLDAARSWRGAPVARAVIADRRIRWRTLHDWPTGPDLGLADQFSNGSLILRAVSDDGGRIWVARVADAGSAAQWESWSVVAADARSACDVAITWMPLLTWARVYESAAGHQVRVRNSTNDGLTWSEPTVLHTAAQTPWVAAWWPWVFVLEGHLHAYHWTGSAWEGPVTLNAPMTQPHGVAAYYSTADQWGHILYAAGGQLHKVELNASGATPAFTTPRVLSPGGDQAASGVAGIALPSLTRVAPLGMLASWVEQHTGPLADWRFPVCAVARDPAPGAPSQETAQHFGQACPLAPPQTSALRWPLAYDGNAAMLYTGSRRRVVSAPLYDPVLRGWMRLGPLDVTAYRRTAERHAPGDLTLELPDADMAYRNPGATGGTAQAVSPLAAVRLQRGYRTAAGDETVDTPNYYVTSAALTEGQGAGRLLIEAVDAFGLLALWRPVESLVWTDRSVGWLLAEVCGRVGLRVTMDDPLGHTLLSETLPQFSLHPHHTALTAVQTLLRLKCAVARPADDDTLLLMPYPDGAGTAAIGDADEIRSAAYGPARFRSTHLRVASEAHDAFAEGENVADSQAMGQRFSTVWEDNRITSGGMARSVAAHGLRLAHTLGRADRVTVPLRPDLEVWDTLALHADPAAIPADARQRLIVRLREDVAPAQNRFASELALAEP